MIFEIEAADDATSAFLDTKTGEPVYLMDPLYTGERDEKLAERIEDEPERFLQFPTQYDIHDYSIMESFVEEMPVGPAQNNLASAIRGKGAFRRFKDTVVYLGIEKSWYAYQKKAYREIAIRWCQDNGLEWTSEKIL